MGFCFPHRSCYPGLRFSKTLQCPSSKLLGLKPLEAKVITEEILEIVGVSQIATKTVKQLNGLDEMLAALARALIHHPRVLIAELVGNNMHEDEAEKLLSILRASGQRLGLAVIATLAPHISWNKADVRLEIGPEGVEEFIRRDPNG